MEVLDILNLDGIVVRKVPNTVISRWRVYPNKQGKFGPLKQNESFVSEPITHPRSKAVHRVVEQVNENNLNYMITFDRGTGSAIRFSTKSCGVGATIGAAYKDLLSKLCE